MTGTMFDELVRTHMADTFRFCLALAGNEPDAEDLMQETFVRALRAWPTFRGESAFRTWLFSIAVHTHRDGLRRGATFRRRAAALAPEEGRPNPGIAQAQARDLERALLDRLGALPARQREVLALHLQDGLSYDQIARALGITYADVKVNLSVARRRLREECRGVLG